MPTAKKLSRAQKILLELTSYAKQLPIHERALQDLFPKCYVHTEAWVTEMIAQGECANKQDAIRRLAGTLKRTHGVVQHWYNLGNVMREFRIPAKNVHAQAIRYFVKNVRMLTKYEQTQCLHAIKNKGMEAGKLVARVIETSKTVQSGRAYNTATTLKKHRQLNKNRLRMDMHALGTLASAHYGHPVNVYVCDEDGNELLHTEGRYEQPE